MDVSRGLIMFNRAWHPRYREHIFVLCDTDRLRKLYAVAGCLCRLLIDGLQEKPDDFDLRMQLSKAYFQIVYVEHPI